jgi:hypothetical protein
MWAVLAVLVASNLMGSASAQLQVEGVNYFESLTMY